MIISEVIRRASTTSEIHFLLAAYVETAGYSRPPADLPVALGQLPIRGIDDIDERLDRLRSACATPDELPEQDRAFLGEALEIFDVALGRLKYLAEAERWQGLRDAVV